MSDIATAFADEVVTTRVHQAHLRPRHRGPGCTDHPRQRLRPHQAELVRSRRDSRPSTRHWTRRLPPTRRRSPSPASRSSSPPARTSRAFPPITAREQGLELGRSGPQGVPTPARVLRSRPSPSSTASRSAAASRSACTATTARLPTTPGARPARERSSAWSPAGAARSCSPTSSARPTPSPW